MGADKKKFPTVRRFVGLTGMVLLIAAVVTELRKPAQDRTWHGRLAGKIPYDLRPPTLARIRESVWNPDEPRVIVDRAFGVGWSVNFAALLKPITG